MHIAGGSVHISGGRTWWAEIPKEEWPEDEGFKTEVLSNWNKDFGDRSQTLVVIGLHMDRKIVEAELRACLLTDEEMALGVEAWKLMDDPFPSTSVANSHDHMVTVASSDSGATSLIEAEEIHLHDETCNHTEEGGSGSSRKINAEDGDIAESSSRNNKKRKTTSI